MDALGVDGPDGWVSDGLSLLPVLSFTVPFNASRNAPIAFSTISSYTNSSPLHYDAEPTTFRADGDVGSAYTCNDTSTECSDRVPQPGDLVGYSPHADALIFLRGETDLKVVVSRGKQGWTYAFYNLTADPGELSALSVEPCKKNRELKHLRSVQCQMRRRLEIWRSSVNASNFGPGGCAARQTRSWQSMVITTLAVYSEQCVVPLGAALSNSDCRALCMASVECTGWTRFASNVSESTAPVFGPWTPKSKYTPLAGLCFGRTDGLTSVHHSHSQGWSQRMQFVRNTAVKAAPTHVKLDDDTCFSVLPAEPAGPPPISPPPALDWTWAATVLQPWGVTQWALVKNASHLAPLLKDSYGFNTVILLPAPAHETYCGVGGGCSLTAAEITAGAASFRHAGWRVILYTSFMHVGEARAWTNGSLTAAHPDWAQRNASGSRWQFEGANSPLSPCSEEVLAYTMSYAVAQAAPMQPDATMLDNNEIGPMAWGCASSGCGYEPPCAAAFDAYARGRFNASTLKSCFGVNSSDPIPPPARSQLGEPIYGLWIRFRNVAMAALNQRFASVLRSGGRRLLANTAIDWPDFSLAQDLQYTAEDVVLSEVYDTDPAKLHASLSLGIGLAQGRPYWAALYQNAMKAVELPSRTIERVLTSAAAHQARPWLVFEQVLLNATDLRAVALRRTQGWLMREAAALRGGAAMSPVACMASASTRNSAWNNATSTVAITPTRCLRRATELSAPARVVYDLDQRSHSEWLVGVKLLVLDSVRCLPQRTVRSIVAWAAEGGTVLASEDSGLCDGLARAVPPRFTLASQLGAAGTWANLSSDAAAALIGAQAWMHTPSNDQPWIVLPYLHETHVTVFVLCAEASGCANSTATLTVPLNASVVGSVRLTAASATAPLTATTSKQGVSVQLPEPLPDDEFAVVISLKTLDEAALTDDPNHLPGIGDALWLRYPLVSSSVRLEEYRHQIGTRAAVVCAGGVCDGKVARSQLQAAAEELRAGLSGLLGEKVEVSVGGAAGGSTLVASVLPAQAAALGKEGFRISRGGGTVRVDAASSSSLLYGVFRLLATMQQNKALPTILTSTPAVELRVFELWDVLDGSVTRGYAGRSLLWPHALYMDDVKLPRNKLFLTACNESDAHQQWEFPSGNDGEIVNVGNGQCLSNQHQNPMQTTANKTACTAWLLNANHSISAKGEGRCIDVQNGEGPDIDIWHCKLPYSGSDPHAIADRSKQKFVYSKTTKQWMTEPGTHAPGIRSHGRCLGLLKLWPAPEGLSPWQGRWKKRFEHMVKLLKSAGLNGIGLNDVNADPKILDSALLKNISANIGPILERWGLAPYISASYAAPFALANISSNPSNPKAQQWWNAKAAEIKQLLPTFAGFVVKADSEGNQGPHTFNKTEADGANLLARALKPVAGVVLWRAFVYGGQIDGQWQERAKQAYLTFKPLDGKFNDNVIVQIKNGPMDFQIREPVSPLLAGALKRTNLMMEVQAAHEYTGQALHAVGLTTMWSSYLGFDIANDGTTVGGVLSGKDTKHSDGRAIGKGMACVSNFGDWANFTGHVMSASNAYGCGRLAWDPEQASSDIHAEWAAMTFARAGASELDRTAVTTAVTSILDRGWLAYEGYTSPNGIGFMCTGCGSGMSPEGCAPQTKGPGRGPAGAACPFNARPDHLQGKPWGHPGGLEDGHQAWHYFIDPCDNYAQANYSSFGIGCDRANVSGTGTGYTDQYLPAVAAMLENVSTCPTELLLFMHNLPWTHPMKLANGSTVQLIDYIAASHAAAVATAASFGREWQALRPHLDAADSRFEGVAARLRQQLVDARAFSAVVMGQYLTWAGRPNPYWNSTRSLQAKR